MAATVAQPSPVPGGGVGQEYNLNSRNNRERENGGPNPPDGSQHQKVPPRHQQLSPRDFSLVRTLGTGIGAPLTSKVVYDVHDLHRD